MVDPGPVAGTPARPRRDADRAAAPVASVLVALLAVVLFVVAHRCLDAVPGRATPGATWLVVLAGGLIALAALAAALAFREQHRFRALRREGEHLRDLASLDPMTMLANRRSFDEALPSAWRAAARAGGPVSLVLIDADHFKAFNDRFGHLEGDGALRSLAAALRAELRRAEDRAFRIGGEEFAVLLPGTDAAGAALVAGAIRAGVARHALHLPGTDGRRFTVSMGVAQAMPTPSTGPGDADTLFAAADRALYGAKSAGRNRIRVAAVLPRRDGNRAGTASTVDGVEIVLPSGRVLRVNRAIDLPTLRGILGVLAEP